MYLVYSSLAILEVVILLLSVCGLVFLVGRAIVRVFAKPGEEAKRVSAESLQHLKRAGQSGYY